MIDNWTPIIDYWTPIMTDSVVPEPYYAAQELHSAAMGACYAALGAYMAHMLHMLHMAGVPGS